MSNRKLPKLPKAPKLSKAMLDDLGDSVPVEFSNEILPILPNEGTESPKKNEEVHNEFDDFLSISESDSTKSAGGNTKTPARYDHQCWFFTLNNYTDNDIAFIPTLPNLSKYFFQKECGNKTQTPHLQGVLYFSKRCSLTYVKSIFTRRAKLGPLKDWISAMQYCTKQDTKVGYAFTNVEELRRNLIKSENKLKYRKLNELFKWSQTLWDILDELPDDRTINWIYDPDGKNGKSQMFRTLQIDYDHQVIGITGGKEADVINMINNKVEDGFELIQDKLTILIDLPRSKSTNGETSCISYPLLENLKNGFCVNTKFKAKSFIFNPPHIVIFSNYLPEFEKMTLDKWRVYTIHQSELRTYNINTGSIS